jgi:hypothetical protein
MLGMIISWRKKCILVGTALVNVIHLFLYVGGGIYLLFIKHKQLFGPNPCPNPAGVSCPPTPYIPLPLPSKTLDPWLGSRVRAR